MDVLFDATADGRRFQFLNGIDEHRRLCLAIRVGRRCKAKDSVSVLEALTCVYPAPACIRSDNGPEFIAQALRDWCWASTTTTMAYTAPGSPGENGFAESYERRSTSSTTAASGMSSPTLSCAPQLRKRRSWPIVDEESATH
jgi:putative transposase